jgi:hypothetical protein
MEAPKRNGPIYIIPAIGGELTDSQLNDEIARLEASTERYEEADPDEIESDEYASLLTRLTKLREERDGRA